MTGPSGEQIEPFKPLEVLNGPPPEARPGTGPPVRDLGGGHHAVTFLWQGDAAQVLVLVNTVSEGQRHDPGPMLMERLPGNGGWHRTFRFPSDLRATYQFHPSDGPVDTADPESWARVRRGAVPDPLNPETLPSWIPGVTTSVLELPGAPPQPWRDARPGVPRGTVTAHLVPSAALGTARTVHVYVPAGPVESPDLLVLLDGGLWAETVPIAPTLDNLIAEGLVPPMVALMPASGDAAVRDAELGGDEPFLAFLTGELPRWASRHWPVTADPARSTIAGQSLGGLTAAAAALRAPGRFGNVLAQSGAFWLDGEALTRASAGSPPPRVRFYLEVGRNEWRLRPAVRRFRDMLRAHGRDVAFTEYGGGHDLACWRGGLADGLLALAHR
ncbi:alpha/beta hydrolase-fold protein [Spirillospora sp. NBC_01491]|uniref:alpha/beta hydrolase-fold protein n=1 Tax=Spirillospora sp. NBC_01491 TaxID=2976007 RepID=UPI002E2FA020|nr:alpha/beta hydrolase-fold protein [Spirillospora sp. NBC_01491]